MERKEIKKEAKLLLQEHRWNAVLGGLLQGAASGSSVAAVGLVLGGPLEFGFTDYCLRAVRKEENNTGVLFTGFSNSFGKNFGLFILRTVYVFLWYLLFCIPGIIKSYSYSMAFYLMKDNPELGPKDAITASRKLMNGHKWELFILDLSFILWILLGCLTFGILLILHVGPWMSLSRAKFYESIKEQPAPEKAEEPAEQPAE